GLGARAVSRGGHPRARAPGPDDRLRAHEQRHATLDRGRAGGGSRSAQDQRGAQAQSPERSARLPMTEILLVHTTFANEDDAARVVRVLVEERLIACGNIVPGVRSLYRWQDGIADEREVLVLMKTRKQ